MFTICFVEAIFYRITEAMKLSTNTDHSKTISDIELADTHGLPTVTIMGPATELGSWEDRVMILMEYVRGLCG